MKKNGTIRSILDLENQKDWLGENPFTVPEDYFETAEKEIRLRAKVTRLTENAFSVPENYTDKLQQAILTRVAEESLKTSRKRPSTSVFRLNRWLPYAAAACLLLGIGLYTFFEISNKQNAATYTLIEKVPTDEIIDYLAFYSESGDMQYLSAQLPEGTEDFTDFFTSEEIEAYLENGL